MTAIELIQESGVEYEIMEEVEKLGQKVWNAAVLACEDAANTRYDEALGEGWTHEEAFDAAMEDVRGLKAE